MVLHEAMITVLKKANKPLTCSEIADKINDQNLYKRNNLTGGDISARLSHHLDKFNKNESCHPMLISLFQ